MYSLHVIVHSSILLLLITASRFHPLVESTDTVVTGKCFHTYHRHCILGWLELKIGKSDCPYCRQHLWSTLEYDDILRQLEDEGMPTQSQDSATVGVDIRCP